MLNLSAVDENKDIATKEYADTKALKTEAIKNITRSGTTFTATRCDNTTFTFTQQDNNSVTGVKGNSESSYRTGNVNLTPANIGAAASNHTHSIVDIGWPSYKQTVDNRTMRTMFDSTRANRLAFLPASQIIVEKTTDGGATWVDAGFTDAQKENIFAETRGYYAPIPTLNGTKNQNCGLRFTITAMRYDVPSGTPETEKYAYWNSSHVLSQERYAYLSEMYFWVSATGDQLSVKVEAANGNSSTNWSTRFENPSFGMVGWSGNDYISLSGGAFGGGITQVSQFWNWRITLMTKFTNGSSPVNASQQSVGEIRAYGYAFWGSSNNYMANDHLYSWDYRKNATFPAQLTATQFNGALNGNASTATTATSATTLSATLRADKGGTGQTTLKAAANSLLASLDNFTADPTDTTKLIRRDTEGSSVFGQIQFLTVWNYIKGKISSILGLTSSQYGGNAATATNASKVNNLTVQTAVPANAVFTDTVTRVKGNSESSYRSGDVNLTAANIGAATASHNHAAGDITSGVLAEARGGTGASSFMTALNTNLVSIADDYGAMWLDNDEIVIGGSLPTDYGGVPSGGSVGQVLTKTSSGYAWQTPSSGTGRQSTYYTTCSTAQATAAKVLTISGYTPSAGDVLTVYFSTANTANAPTINLNSTGAKAIYVGSAAASSTNQLLWNAGDTLMFVFSGSYWYFVSRAKGDTFTTLYNNTTGTNGTVTLSSSAANFDHMRIYFKKSSGQNGCGSVDVYSPNGKYVNLTIFEPDSSSAYLWFASRTVYINGTSVSTYGSAVGGAIGASTSCGSNTELNITRIEAWK